MSDKIYVCSCKGSTPQKNVHISSLPTSGHQPNVAAYFLTLVIYVVLCGECAKATCLDTVISKVYQYAQNVWPASILEELLRSKQYEIGLKRKLSYEGNLSHYPCQITNTTHSTRKNHSYESNCIQVFLWNGLNEDIEKLAYSCKSCQVMAMTSYPFSVHILFMVIAVHS